MDREQPKRLDLNFMLQQMRQDSEDWFGAETANNLTIMTLGLVGESGEVADIVKKLARGSLTMEEAASMLAEELIDVFHYWLMMVGMFGIDIQVEYDKKRAINVARWGDGNKGRLNPDDFAG